MGTTVAIILARAGSKGIPRKIIKPIAGRPLVHWVTEAALGANGIDLVYVASEDAEVRAVTSRIVHPKLRVIDRDPANAGDRSTSEVALLEFAELYPFDRVVLIQATSPLLTSADLDGALERLEGLGATSALSVTRAHRFRWKFIKTPWIVAPENYDPTDRPFRQEWGGELHENGAFYITSRTALIESGCRLSGKIVAWEMPQEAAVELDEPADWPIVEGYLMARERAKLAERCKPIELIVSDVDGTLTDGGMYYGEGGDELKKFNTADGFACSLWRAAGGRVVLMTGESAIVGARAAKLGIEALAGVSDKGAAMERLLEREGLRFDQVAFLGNDLNDLPGMAMAGLAACPADAAEAVKAVSHYVCRRKGGEGCLRELVDFILAAKG